MSGIFFGQCNFFWTRLQLEQGKYIFCQLWPRLNRRRPLPFKLYITIYEYLSVYTNPLCKILLPSLEKKSIQRNSQRRLRVNIANRRYKIYFRSDLSYSSWILMLYLQVRPKLRLPPLGCDIFFMVGREFAFSQQTKLLWIKCLQINRSIQEAMVM